MAEHITLYNVFQCEVGQEDRLAEAATEDRNIDGAALLAVLDDFVALLGGAEVDDISRDVLNPLYWLGKRVAAANNEVSGYLDSRYGDVPAENFPPIVATRTMDIALYRIYGGESDSERYQHFQAAIRFFREVAAGRVDLNVSAPAEQERPVARVTGGTREFDDAAWSTY